MTDSRNPRAGAHLEIVGHVNPLTDPATINLKEERLVHWLQVGAQPSDTAAKLLTKAGVMEKAGKAPVVYEGKEVPSAEKKSKKAAAEAPAPAAVAPAPAPEASAAEEPAAEAPEEPTAAAEQAAEAEPTADAEPAPEEPATDETPAEETSE